MITVLILILYPGRRTHAQRLDQRKFSLFTPAHAHQPVDWHPWGEAALEKAEKEQAHLS